MCPNYQQVDISIVYETIWRKKIIQKKHKMIWIFERVIVIWSFWIISLSVLTTVWGDETLANANEKTSSRAGIKALVAPAREMVSDVPNCKLTFYFLGCLAWRSAAWEKLIWFSVLTFEQKQKSDQASDKDGSNLVCNWSVVIVVRVF